MWILTIACFAAWFAPASAQGLDTDGDGIADDVDVCPDTAPGSPVDDAGRPLADFDGDCDVDLDDYSWFMISFTGPFECKPEICDGLDNDCNELIDDAGTIECGLGACRRVVEACLNAAPNTCVPGLPQAEVCSDSIDNDCDGLSDCADYVNCPFHTPCAAGVSCDRRGQCTCANGFDDCDNNVDNGCETSTRTNANCNGCDIICDLPNGTESCSTGTCSLTSCNNGYCNRDGQSGNGCEVFLNNSPSCAGATFLGSISGDTGGGVLNASGAGERWYRVTVTENDSSPFGAYLSATVGLQISPGVDYDLYVYCLACGGNVTSSIGGLGVSESVSVRRNDHSGEDDTFDILIEIRWYAGGGSGGCDWSLRVDGHTTVSLANCGS